MQEIAAMVTDRLDIGWRDDILPAAMQLAQVAELADASA
jgi:hypothetical protein